MRARKSRDLRSQESRSQGVGESRVADGMIVLRGTEDTFHPWLHDVAGFRWKTMTSGKHVELHILSACPEAVGKLVGEFRWVEFILLA